MCGIAGIIAPDTSAADVGLVLQRMTDAITHRGPDDQGHHVDTEVGIGMRRLSIIDVAGGQQPISNEDNTVHVVCNGEIYNFRELREELKTRGHSFTTGSDAEVIVHLYEELGAECFRELRGMFGVAIWDESRKRLVLGRDRLGKKPLYYAHIGDRFLFGSEMKSLLTAEPSLLEPDPRRFAEYFQFGYFHQPNTIYRGIKKLPAGHSGVLQGQQLAIEPFWQLQFETDESKTLEEWSQELDQLLIEAVRVRLQSEVPLGVFLSGGIDSSAIVAYAHAAGLDPLKTFTIAFDRPEWDESEDANRVAKYFATDHHVLSLSEADLLQSMPEMLVCLTRHFDEPFADDSALPTFHVSKLAKEHVTVILGGDGGDELFAGYSSYQGAQFALAYRRWIPGLIGQHVLPGAARFASRLLPGRYRYQAQRASKIFHDSSQPFLEGYRSKTSIWNQSQISQLIKPEVLAVSDYFGDQYLADHDWEIMRATERDIVSRLTEIDIHGYMQDDILMKVDRMSMANALEVRSPFLDHRMVEFAASMPTRFKLQRSKGKAILRDVLARRLPPATIKKKKQGFAVPLREWFRHGLADLVGDYLQYGGGRLPKEIFSQDCVDKLLKQHRDGEVDHGRRIWSLLSFAAWHELYQAGSPSEVSPNLATTSSRSP